MARTIRSVLVILSLFGTAVAFTACGNSPTDVVLEDLRPQLDGFTPNN